MTGTIKLRKYCITMVVLLVAIAGCIASPVTAKASKKAVYESALQKIKTNEYAAIKSVKIKGRTLTIKGSFYKASSRKKIFRDNRQFLKYKTRKFKLTKNCKFYGTGGDGPRIKYTKKTFFKIAKQYNGLGLVLYTNKSGKVYRADLAS